MGVESKRQEAEKKASAPDLWNDPKKAESVLKEGKYWTDLGGRWKSISTRIRDLEELSSMVDPENKEEWQVVEKEAIDLEKVFHKAHVELVLSGPYDQNDAILVISAGTGGTEAQDWAEMLLRMILRYCEKKNWKATVIDRHDGGEVGIKSATLEISGMMVFGFLKSEHGVHRLVRLSPFNAKNLRQTSFALIEVLPVIPDSEGVEINEKDLRIDTYRSSGAGGQHVNKTESAIRITHMPTNIVVTCQTERSQIQNRAQAMAILRSRLTKMMEEEHKGKIDELKGDHKEAAWGNQIRSYVFQPYSMVKDHRTGAETSQVQDVMDGELDMFVEAFLLKSKE